MQSESRQGLEEVLVLVSRTSLTIWTHSQEASWIGGCYKEHFLSTASARISTDRKFLFLAKYRDDTTTRPFKSMK